MKSSVAFLCFLATLTTFSCSHKPKIPLTNETAPESFRVNLDTSKGSVVVEVTRSWSPLGVDRFYNLVKAKFYDDARFFRVVPGFVVQFGMAGDPEAYSEWDKPIPDDPVLVSNRRGTLTFAKASEPNTRATQLFINLGNNQRLDATHFSAFGKVLSGMEFVDQIYSGDGQNPQQDQITAKGNAYLNKEFPHLDYVKTARIVQ